MFTCRKNKLGIEFNLAEKKLIILQNVADCVHVARSTIQRHETGAISQMKAPVLYLIAQALQVNPDWIVRKSEMKYLPTTDPPSRIGFSVNGLDDQRVYNDISEYEFSLLLSYRKAPPEIRYAIDLVKKELII